MILDKAFHGTTIEQLKSIMVHGLRKGTFVTPDIRVASWFASKRSTWTKTKPVILTIDKPKTTRIELDRHGNQECRLVQSYVVVRQQLVRISLALLLPPEVLLLKY